MAKRIRPQRTIEALVDDHGRVTHAKCSQCAWKVPLDHDNCSDEQIRQLFSFWDHDCEDYRIGFTFRRWIKGENVPVP